MAKLRLTKNEFKRQKDALRMFQRYLPVLALKKQQLQLEIAKADSLLAELEEKIARFRSRIESWADVFGEDVGFKELLSIKDIATKEGNIAGVDIPIFESVEFDEKVYDFMGFPIWVDYGIEAAKELILLNSRRKILQKQLELIKEELRITTQRVNLFEKVKIPEAIENIRRINVWLGDLQTAAVVIGKIAKTKIQKREGVLV